MPTVNVDSVLIDLPDDRTLPSELMRRSGIVSPDRHDLLALPIGVGDHAIPEEPMLVRDGDQFITARKSATVS